MQWSELARLEPDLLMLERSIRAAAADVSRNRSRCANRMWYPTPTTDGFKRRLLPLVGWIRDRARGGDPILYGGAAYDAAYKHLYSLLPACVGCVCA